MAPGGSNVGSRPIENGGNGDLLAVRENTPMRGVGFHIVDEGLKADSDRGLARFDHPARTRLTARMGPAVRALRAFTLLRFPPALTAFVAADGLRNSIGF